MFKQGNFLIQSQLSALAPRRTELPSYNMQSKLPKSSNFTVIFQQLFNSYSLRGRLRLVHSPSCCRNTSSSFQGLRLSIVSKIKLPLSENMLLSNHSNTPKFYRHAEQPLYKRRSNRGCSSTCTALKQF